MACLGIPMHGGGCWVVLGSEVHLTWLIHTCDMAYLLTCITHSFLWHNAFVRETRRIHTWYVSFCQSSGWAGSCVCELPYHTRDMIFSYLYQHQQIASSFQPGVSTYREGTQWVEGGGGSTCPLLCVYVWEREKETHEGAVTAFMVACTLKQHTATTHCITLRHYTVTNTARTHCCSTLQQHTATSHCNNTLQQLSAATLCNEALQQCTKVRRVHWLLIKDRTAEEHSYMILSNTLQLHTATIHCNNTLQQHTVITLCNNVQRCDVHPHYWLKQDSGNAQLHLVHENPDSLLPFFLCSKQQSKEIESNNSFEGSIWVCCSVLRCVAACYSVHIQIQKYICIYTNTNTYLHEQYIVYHSTMKQHRSLRWRLSHAANIHCNKTLQQRTTTHSNTILEQQTATTQTTQ